MDKFDMLLNVLIDMKRIQGDQQLSISGLIKILQNLNVRYEYDKNQKERTQKKYEGRGT